MKRILVVFINIYQKTISPFLIPSCRFSPSCSEYSKSAYLNFNFFKATLLIFKRIARCNPLGGNGYDPLPLLEVQKWKKELF